MSKFGVIITSSFGVIGGAIITQLGGWTQDFITLFTMMVVDFIMGFSIAAIWKKSTKSKTGSISSLSMWKGLCKKGCTLFIVWIGCRLDITFGTQYIRSAVIIAYIVNEGVSIIEKAGIMGIPIPNIIKKSIELLKQKEDANE
jgi:toxin secretion/phage lysis holin